MNRELIGHRLRELRGEMTQQQLAAELGVADSSIGMYESGERIPKDEIKIKYAQFFQKTVQEIFFEDECHE